MGRLFDWRDAEPRRDFDRRPFAFRHALANEPLFDKARLVELDARAGAGPVVLDREPDYGGFLERCAAELREALPALGREGALVAALVRTAAGSTGGFEIDPSSGFVILLAGAATIRIFDRATTGVPSSYDLERFYQRGGSGVAESLERSASEATDFRLGPGDAIHRPRHAASALATDEATAALALQLTVVTRAARRELAAHSVNGLLRIAGVNARPAGESAGRDRIKQAALAIGHLIQPLVERLSGGRES